MTKTSKLAIISSATLILFGLVLLGLGYIRHKNANLMSQPAADSSQVVTVPAGSVNSGIPTRLSIPSLRISLPVIDGYYDKTSKAWTLTSNKAQYAVMTPPANDVRGNTFIYGHNRQEVFANLPKISWGDTAKIYTNNGLIFNYTFIGARLSKPTDNAIFKYQGPPILTLQTCSGLFFQNRQLFTFNLSGVEHV